MSCYCALIGPARLGRLGSLPHLAAGQPRHPSTSATHSALDDGCAHGRGRTWLPWIRVHAQRLTRGELLAEAPVLPVSSGEGQRSRPCRLQPEKRATGGGTRDTKTPAVGRRPLQGVGRRGRGRGIKGQQGMFRERETEGERERDQGMRRWRVECCWLPPPLPPSPFFSSLLLSPPQ